MPFFHKNLAFTRYIGIIFILIGIVFQACNHRDESTLKLAEKVNFFSSVLNEERTLLVSLPRGYESSKKAYPVLYVLDADFIPYFTRVVGTVGEQSLQGNIPEIIIVGIENVDRERDMFPVPVDRWPNSGGADNFLRFLSEELIPYINSIYRTEDFQLLYGASNAGLFVVHALLSQSELFNAYLASSPMVGWCYQFIYDEARNQFASDKSLDVFLYMIWGKNDMDAVTHAVPYLEKIIQEEAPEDFKWSSLIIEEEGHVPYASLYHGLSFVFNGWNYPPERYETSTLESIETYYHNLSEGYGFEVSIPMFVYLETGNNLRSRGEIQAALEVFKVNLEKYPDDPNALFYLGEGYWDDGQKDLAIQYYRKTLEMDPTYSPAIQKLKSLEKNK